MSDPKRENQKSIRTGQDFDEVLEQTIRSIQNTANNLGTGAIDVKIGFSTVLLSPEKKGWRIFSNPTVKTDSNTIEIATRIYPEEPGSSGRSDNIQDYRNSPGPTEEPGSSGRPDNNQDNRNSPAPAPIDQKEIIKVVTDDILKNGDGDIDPNLLDDKKQFKRQLKAPEYISFTAAMIVRSDINQNQSTFREHFRNFKKKKGFNPDDKFEDNPELQFAACVGYLQAVMQKLQGAKSISLDKIIFEYDQQTRQAFKQFREKLGQNRRES